MRGRKRKLAALLVLVLALGLEACVAFNKPEEEMVTELEGEQRVDDMTPTDDNLIVVGVSQVGSESVWRTANTNSIQETFTTDNGYFLIFNNARQKQENQIKAIRGFISQHVDYILLSPITEDGWDTVLQEAKEEGIPVILFDRKLKVEDESLYTTWVGSDFEQEGLKAGQWLEQYLTQNNQAEQDLNILILQGTLGSNSEVGRTKGFQTIAESHLNWHILESCDAEYTTTKAKEEMKRMLAEYGKPNVVVAQNDDMMFGAVEALNEAGYATGPEGDIVMISFDACKNALKMVEDGRINVDIECNPLQGTYLEDIIECLESGQTVEKETYIEEEVFDITNVGNQLKNRTY